MSPSAMRSEDAALADPDESLLAVRDLDAGYGDLQVLDGVDMDVGDGEYVVIVGPNGAGKSTVMKSVFGLTTYFGGDVVFDGRSIERRRPDEIIHEGIGYVPQTDNVFASLSVRENLEMGAYILDEVPEDRIESIYDPAATSSCRDRTAIRTPERRCWRMSRSDRSSSAGSVRSEPTVESVWPTGLLGYCDSASSPAVVTGSEKSGNPHNLVE